MLDRSEKLTSAGGVIYRRTDGKIQVVICGRIKASLWALPKGTPDDYETRTETAIREVREETGLEVVVEIFIDSIHYSFTRKGTNKNYQKEVFFYLMRKVGGDFSRHDKEFDIVKWVNEKDVASTLTYHNEVDIVQKGLSLVKIRRKRTPQSRDFRR